MPRSAPLSTTASINAGTASGLPCCGLNGIQKTRDGEPLSGEHVSAEEAFGAPQEPTYQRLAYQPEPAAYGAAPQPAYPPQPAAAPGYPQAPWGGQINPLTGQPM